LVASLALSALPFAVQAHADGSPAPAGVDTAALADVCSASLDGELGVAACLLAVVGFLDDEVRPAVDAAASPNEGATAPDDLLGQAFLAAGHALDSVQQVDVGQTIRDTLAAAQGADLQGALDETISAARDFAAGAALAAALETDVGALFQDGVEAVRDVAGAAQRWAQDNPALICRGGSFGLGGGAAALLAYVIGNPGLARRAFEEGGRIGNDVCTDMMRPPA
jgi:hypothetical protein